MITAPLRPRGRAALARTLLAAVLLAGCGGTDAPRGDEPAATAAPPAPPAAGAREVCGMLSVEEVSAATGVAGECQAATSGGAQVGTWTDASGKSAIVQVHQTAARYEESRQAFESLYGGTAEELPDVGDQAFVIGGRTGPMPTATVGALQGATPISVQVMAMGGDPATLREQAIALTRTVLARL
jgi:hypothetical protein